MIQAAGSGKQNIVEASIVSENQKETEIRLTNMARANLEELLDCENFMRTNHISKQEGEFNFIKAF